MPYDFALLKAELARWRSEGRTLPLWWRDDDAVELTTPLEKLGQLSLDLGLDVHLAVIPKFATPELASLCRDMSQFVPLVHGWAHVNQSTGPAKKAEFGAPRDGAVVEMRLGLSRMEQLFGQSLLPMFVPPWNRISEGFVNELNGLGFSSLSTFTPRHARLRPGGLVQINTHVDPISWRGGGGLAEPDVTVDTLIKTLKDRREGRSDAAEPLGFLTHHLVHDAPIWEFTDACLKTLIEGGAEAVNLRNSKDSLP